MKFSGHSVLVTGAASGLGLASVERLVAEGASILAFDRSEAVMDLPQRFPSVIAATGDVTSEADFDRAMTAGIGRFGQIDRFHLNAGITGPFDALPDLDVADFNEVLQVNVTGQFIGLRAAFRHYRERAAGGSIVITASIASRTGGHDLLAYHTSKHAVVGLVKGAAVYGGPLGIRVNAVAPGLVPTGLFRSAAGQLGGGDDMVQRARTTPLRRAGTASEVAGVVAFLLSDDSSYTTGEVVGADGGASIVNTVRPAGGAGRWDVEALDEATYAKEELQAARARRESHGADRGPDA